MIIQLENSASMAGDATQWCSVCLANLVPRLQSPLTQTKQKQRHHVKFQQISKDSFGLCTLSFANQSPIGLTGG